MIPIIVLELARSGCSITLQPPLTLRLAASAFSITLLQQAKIEKTDILNWLIHADTQTLASTLLQGLALTYEDVRFICKHLQVHNRYEQLQLLARYRTAYQDAADQVTNEQQQAAAGVKAANTWLRSRR